MKYKLTSMRQNGTSSGIYDLKGIQRALQVILPFMKLGDQLTITIDETVEEKPLIKLEIPNYAGVTV